MGITRNIAGASTYCYTGGKTFDPEKPTLVFLHGVLNDHSVWILQTRWLAHHGFNVLAVDLPGHGRSAGAPPASVEAGADFVRALLDDFELVHASLIGHSFGSLIALETAAREPLRTQHLAMVATAAPMAVSDALLQASRERPLEAIDMVNAFSHSMLAPPPSALGPGNWVPGSSRALMRRVLASNRETNLFHTGFVACDSYRNAVPRMEEVRCPVLFVLGERDQMTPPKAANALISAAGDRAKTVMLPGGHSLMTEVPDGVLFALRDFFSP
jgi:pimeloyl-ACP methyl ester carboxylesterase